MHLLHLFNHMLQTHYVPTDWKTATVIPIRKPDKPAEKPESYRPISLTSCLGKVMERIVNQRLSWSFETKGKRLKTQCGFRKGRSTLDNQTGLELYIREGFNKRKPLNTYAIFLDIAKAFDTTWIQGLLFKICRKGVRANTLGWLNNLLRNRTYNVRIGNTHSEDRNLKVGVPQGSPLSPLLFSVMMDDFPILDSPGETYMFADDIESHIHASDGHEAETLLTPHLDSISKWSRKWRINFSPEKIHTANQVKHLGVYFDKGLRWIKQTEVAISKAVKIKNLFTVLSNTKHGPSLDSLSILYKALARSRLEYGLTVYGSSSKGRKAKLETVQNDILRIILNAQKSTPIKEMQCELGIPPLDSRRTWLAGRYIFRTEKDKNHPLHSRCKDLCKIPKTWKDHNIPSLKQAMAHIALANIDLFQHDLDYYPTHHGRPPWKESPIAINFFPSPNPQTCLAYTDGSLNKFTGKTTYAVFIPSQGIQEATTITKNSSVFTAESEAINRAMELNYHHPTHTHELTIISDSRSVLQAIESPQKIKHPVINTILTTADTLKAAGTKVNLYWIPSHVGIPGNEMADQLASEESDQRLASRVQQNQLTSAEQAAVFKEYLREKKHQRAARRKI
uniref:RNA-directed DNA polymerase from transposon BS n=1 Tax=Daphnia galeata TaxID=27404 RepID=A0A8J2WJA3_9CRUS|nr:unnamed protein product [Daphnia galeata]